MQVGCVDKEASDRRLLGEEMSKVTAARIQCNPLECAQKVDIIALKIGHLYSLIKSKQDESNNFP